MEDKIRDTRKELDKLEKENEVLQKKKQLPSIGESSRIGNEIDDLERNDVNSGGYGTIHFRDLESFIPKFEGMGTYRVEAWVDEYENICKMYKLNPLQKLIFAKQSLKGTAEKAMGSARKIYSWDDLKTFLISEFSRKISSAEIHSQLRLRKKRRNESIWDYFYDMRQLGSLGDVEDAAIISYIIDGIEDAPSNKVLLYGASSMATFREKLVVYEDFKSKQPNSSNANNYSKRDLTTHDAGSKPRCFNCGKIGHQSKKCYKKDEGPRCFKCLQYGHKAPECKKVVSSEQRRSEFEKPKETVLASEGQHKIKYNHKLVKLNDKTIEALIDTGGDLTLLRETDYHKMDLPVLKLKKTKLKGIGDGAVTTIGYFSANFKIDDDEYRTDVYVVPGETLTTVCVLGNDVLADTEITVKAGGFLVRKLNFQDELPKSCFLENDLEYEVGNNKHRGTIANLIDAYKPTNSKEAPVQMKIILKSDIPICSFQCARK